MYSDIENTTNLWAFPLIIDKFEDFDIILEFS